jgi:ParB family chromosome partitioning protein
MPPRKKKLAPQSVGLAAAELGSTEPPREVTALARVVEKDGGSVLASYREPLGGHWLLFAALPIEKVEPTPFQRELSDAHAKRLEGVIPKVGRFLDPLIAVRHPGGYWVPNGMHRLEAMKRLGARSVVVLLVPETEIAFRLLALNTEKAHNVKDKSLEVVRMADVLAEDRANAERAESHWAFEFEEAALLTIGRCYQEQPRFSGGAYMPVVRRVEGFLDLPLVRANQLRRERAEKIRELDKAVDKCVKALKAAGLTSSYLKPFVVARLNPLRFAPRPGAAVKGGKAAAKPPPDFDATFDKMLAKAAAFDASKVKPSDITAAPAYAE